MGENINQSPIPPKKEAEKPWFHDGKIIQAKIDPKTRDLEVAIQTGNNGNLAVCYILFISFLAYNQNINDPHEETSNFREIFELGRKVHLSRQFEGDLGTNFSFPELGEEEEYRFPSRSVKRYMGPASRLTNRRPSDSIKNILTETAPIFK